MKVGSIKLGGETMAGLSSRIPSDIEIARSAKLKPILEIAEEAGLR